MLKKKIKSLFIIFILFFILSKPLFAHKASLLSFEYIRQISLTSEEKEIGIINFEEFFKIHHYNYFHLKPEKTADLEKLERDLTKLRYSSENLQQERKPPIILHWTAGDTAMGAIKTLFQERNHMEEGLIGVDYVISEPLIDPEKPSLAAKSYIIKLSASDVATTWFHVPEEFRAKMSRHHKKYNKAINIEIVGWRFLERKEGITGNYGEFGRLGIRNNFKNDYEKIEAEATTYAQVLKLLNYLADKHGFSEQVDNYSPDKEINKKLLTKKKTLYLDGPLSGFIKGHGLIALEHSLLFGSKYRQMKRDFTPEELLIFYEDLQGYRNYQNNQITEKIFANIVQEKKITELEINKIKEEIVKVKDPEKKEFLFYALYFAKEQIDTIKKLDNNHRYLEGMKKNYADRLTLFLLTKFVSDIVKLELTDYEYLNDFIIKLPNKENKEDIRKKILQKIVSTFNENK